jgi:hypothetical protein
MIRKTLLALAVVFAGLIAIGLLVDPPREGAATSPQASPAPPAQPARPAVPTITATALYAAYEENAIRADNRYKGEQLIVVGQITDFGKEILGKPYVTLATGAPYQSVQAVFPRDAAVRLGRLSKGQIIAVQCECSGKLMNVLLSDCTLVKTE